MALPQASSKYGTTQPPNLNPPSVSYSGLPGACRLGAEIIDKVLPELRLDSTGTVFVENVGNSAFSGLNFYGMPENPWDGEPPPFAGMISRGHNWLCMVRDASAALRLLTMTLLFYCLFFCHLFLHSCLFAYARMLSLSKHAREYMLIISPRSRTSIRARLIFVSGKTMIAFI